MSYQSVCEHKKWNIDGNNIGTCANPACQEMRQFPWEKGEEVIVLRESKLVENNIRKKRRQHDVDHHVRHKYYEDNKQAIIDDLLQHGRTFTREKWGINASSSLHSLELRWLTPEQRAQIPFVFAATSAGTPVETQNNSNGWNMAETKKKRKGMVGGRNAEKHAYYLRNKEEICEDLLKLGRRETARKWDIPTSSIHTLIGRWLTDEERAQVEKATDSTNTTLLAVDPRVELPKFPAFSNNWEGSVQVKWLEIYEKLLERA
jgi:hypothetical protein